MGEQTKKLMEWTDMKCDQTLDCWDGRDKAYVPYAQ